MDGNDDNRRSGSIRASRAVDSISSLDESSTKKRQKIRRKFLSMKAKLLILSLVSIYFLVLVNGSLFMRVN